jgi:predicted ester cyclase
MSAETNKAVIRRYFEALSGKDKPRATLDEYIADSDEELKEHIAVVEAAFPRYELIAEDMIAEGDKVVVRATMHAVHKDDYMGIPPTGKQITNAAIIIYRIANGKIAEHWIQVDAVGMMQQLGVMPSPAGQ